MCSFSLGDQQSTWLLADRVLDDGNVSGYHFLLTSEFICCWIFRYEGIRVQLDEDQIMKVIHLRKQTKNSRIYSLVLFSTMFTKPHEKPWKECINPIALSPKLDSTFLHLRVRPKIYCFWSAIKRRIWFFTYCCKLACNTSWATISNKLSKTTDLSYLQWLPRYASKCWWNN